VRWVETRLVTATARLGFPVHRRDTPPGSNSLVGVWAPGERKLASVGMRIRGGITSHGFAINVDPDLDAFRRFTVCGLPDVTMTSLHELAPPPKPAHPDGIRSTRRGCGGVRKTTTVVQ